MVKAGPKKRFRYLIGMGLEKKGINEKWPHLREDEVAAMPGRGGKEQRPAVGRAGERNGM